jgi:glycogen synthase
MHIVLASVLKSHEDVRLHHKIAHSLQNALPDAQIEVWGQGNLYDFKRLGWARIWANLTFFLALWQARPQIVIVATFELLPAGVLYKWLRGGKLGYDVQENYAYNVLYTRVFPRILRSLIAFGIRSIERLALLFVDFVWVAEACYIVEMPFLKKKAVFLPNKVSKKTLLPCLSLPLPARVGKVEMLYSGTVSSDYGVFDAVEWALVWQTTLPSLTLKIVGHCPQEKDKIKLENLALAHSWIVLEIASQPLPHAQLMRAMQAADWLVMPYQINKSVQNRIPTKFYEALALGKRMLVRENKAWQTFMQDFPEAVVVWISVAKDLKELPPTLPACYTEGVFWEESNFFNGLFSD